MDEVFIKDLLVRGIIGITDRERELPQDILINVRMWTESRKQNAADEIINCVNYRTVAKKIFTYTEKIGRFTVEALAEDLAALCLEEVGVRKVIICVEKPGAVRFSRSVGVQIERSN